MRHLHHTPGILTLPNAWDPASARLFQAAGFQAIATTSSAIAYSLGFPDGERIGRDRMLETVRRIAEAVQVPVSADMETGYGRSPEEVAETARLVREAGAVGINLEDGLLGERGLAPAETHAAKLRAVRAAVPEMVVNARTDMYLKNLGAPAECFTESVRRGRLYLEAGADCVFVPGVRDADAIGRLVREIGGPVNILALPSVPPLRELERLGVARVTFGGGGLRATLGLLRRIARELLQEGTYGALMEGALSTQEMQEWVIGSPRAAGSQ